uniref:Peptidase C39-like domain-containing protein n=1 Tax=Panagrolaimus sp. PS1159 TaxID=55785 RepID=A0AC35G108_9BILA
MDIPYAECYAKRTGGHAVIIVGWTADYWIA